MRRTEFLKCLMVISWILQGRDEFCSHLSARVSGAFRWAIRKTFWCLSYKQREKIRFTDHNKSPHRVAYTCRYFRLRRNTFRFCKNHIHIVIFIHIIQWELIPCVRGSVFSEISRFYGVQKLAKICQLQSSNNTWNRLIFLNKDLLV